MSKAIECGALLPQGKLKDQDGEIFEINHGRRMLLSFHPLAWTPVCRDQMLSLEANYDKFLAKDVLPLGLSIDPVPSKKAWADAIGINSLKLLADFWPHGGFAESLGLFRSHNGFSERANVLVEANGSVSWVKVYEIKLLPDIDEVLSVI